MSTVYAVEKYVLSPACYCERHVGGPLMELVLNTVYLPADSSSSWN